MTLGDALALMVSALSAANLERNGVTYEVQVGDEYLDANSAPPRIVVVPVSSTPSGARLQPPGTTRSIAGETHFFAAELWHKAPNGSSTKGADYVAVSTMRATFTAQMRASFGVNFKLGNGQWASTEGESIEEDGRRYLQQFSLDGVTLDFPVTTATVEHTDFNIGATDPGVDYTDP